MFLLLGMDGMEWGKCSGLVYLHSDKHGITGNIELHFSKQARGNEDLIRSSSNAQMCRPRTAMSQVEDILTLCGWYDNLMQSPFYPIKTDCLLIFKVKMILMN